MTPERYQEVGRLYRLAVELDAAQRPRYLAEACAGDEALRAEVEALLGYQAQGGRLLDQPALELATLVLDEKRVRSLAGQRVGHCQLLALLGKGGMGEVWLAEDTQLGRRVAVKLLPAAFTHDADRVRRFAQEARAASSLNHPNIITIHEIGQLQTEAGGTHYIVTEYVEGETLRQRMTSAPRQQIKLAEAIDIALQVAAALRAAHEAGIVHRDIKPENVMVRPDDYVKVLDFGLAKLTESSTPVIDTQSPTTPNVGTESGVVMGTPRYMSPEQARGEKVDARTDIFSLGVMLYEMLAGRAPFAGATLSDVIAAILRDSPPPLSLDAPTTPPEMERIIGKALQKNREARYQSVNELLADLKWLKRELERRDELKDEWARAGQPPLEGEISAGGNGGAGTLLNTVKLAQSTTEHVAAMTWRRRSFDNLKRHKLGIAFTLALLSVIVAAALYFNSFSRGESAIESLAVLPFVNVGANPDAEYLSDGITDSLINGLSQLPKLKVMSRNSVFRYKEKGADAQQAGNALGVRAVLTGKVTQRGDDLIVSAELVDVRDSSHLWGRQYHHKLSDLQAVQAELSRDIAEKLRPRLASVEQQRLTKRGTENPEAYELYLKGRYHINTLLPESEKRGLEYFQQAVKKDPGFALAYAGLAEIYTGMASVGTTFDVAPKELFQKAKAAASEAVELDSTLAQAHLSLAEIARVFEWDWNTAEREYKRAIELNPNFVPAHHFYAHHLVLMNRFEESLAESQRALALDPLDVGINFHLGWNYYNVRHYDQAEAQLKKTLGMNPNHSGARGILGMVYVQQGRYQEALAAIQKTIEQGGRDIRGQLGRVYAIAGQRDEAQKLLAQLQEEAKHKHVSPYDIAKIYAGLGEKDQAFIWLEKAIAERDGNLTDPGLNVDVVFDTLRSDPRFQDLLRRVGLAQ